LTKKAWAVSVGGYIFSHNSRFTAQANEMTSFWGFCFVWWFANRIEKTNQGFF